MIVNRGDRKNPWYVIECEDCGEDTDEGFDSFDECLDYKKGEAKELGWTSVKDGHRNWEDRCPDCNPYRNQSSENRKPIKRKGKGD